MSYEKSENKRESVQGKTNKRPSRSKIGLILTFPKPKNGKGGGVNTCLSYMKWDSKQFLAMLP